MPKSRTNQNVSIIEHPDIGALIIASPPLYHFDQAANALRLGKPVYCEKPLGVNVRQARELADLAQNASHQAGLVLRHSPSLNYVKRVLDDGVLGNLVSCEFLAHSRMPSLMNYRTDYKLKIAQSGGGILHEENIHDIDIFHYLFGDFNARRIRLDRTDGIEVETGVEAEFLFTNGMEMKYRSLWDPHQENSVRVLKINGDRGSLETSYFFIGDIHLVTGGTKRVIPVKMSNIEFMAQRGIQLPNRAFKQWYSFFADYEFIRSATQGNGCSPSFEDCAKAEERIEELYTQAQ